MTFEFINRLQDNYTKVLKSNTNGIMAQFLNKDVNMARYSQPYFQYTQGKTGYCWLVAGVLCVSFYCQKKRKMNINFNINRLIFFDKIEKANMFFSQIIDNIDDNIESYPNAYILSHAMSDKGQWNMFCNLVRKYGVTPINNDKELYIKPTQELNTLISYLLRIYALKMHTQWKKNNNIKEIEMIRHEGMQLIYNILVDFYGKPLQKIVYNNIVMNPQEYFDKVIDFPFDEYISVIVDNEETYTEYEIDFDGNIVEGTKNRFLKIPNEIFENLIEKQVELDGFCWCSGDIGKFYIKSKKILDDSAFDLTSIVDEQILEKLNRDNIYKYHIGHMTHAIVIHEISIKNIKFFDSAYTENLGSVCDMSRTWFEKYLFQGVVHRSFLSPELKKSVKKVMPWEFFCL